MVLNQPLYAAISTSPLILVPCSYVAGAGGLSPSLIPAGNIVIPNPQSSSPDPQKSVIPTFTVLPGASESDSTPAPDEASSTPIEAKENKAPKETPMIPKVEAAKSPGKSKEDSAEQPLDLSFRKKENENTKRTSPHRPAGSGKIMLKYILS